MRKVIQGVGVLLVLMGVSGAIDHLWTQPIMGVVLNAFDRLVVANVPGLRENALLADLGSAACGVVLVVLAEMLPRARSRP